MIYPTIDAVNQATHIQLARWSRFLPSPGQKAIGTPEFNTVLNQEAAIMNRIVARFQEMGGMTPQISKQIGW
jgi:hypothetical protein